MKRDIKNLFGFTMGATDGEIGSVKDFYFEDLTWKIRYLVVETGNWFSNREVLVAAEALLQLDWSNQKFPTNLTKVQIKDSPSIDISQRVSRQHDMDFQTHYLWNKYWDGRVWAEGPGAAGMAMPLASISMDQELLKNLKQNDPHLRSVKTLQNYSIHALDGIIGDVDGFIIDDNNWKINYLIVDTGGMYPGKKIVLLLNLIKEIKWETSEVIVNVMVGQIKNSPEYDPSKQQGTTYELMLKDYYRKKSNH